MSIVRMLLAVLSGTIVAGSASAQSVSLEVRVAGADRPLPLARVVLDSAARTTDSDGVARFVTTPGAHRLIVSRIGWVADSLDLHLATDTTITVTLSAASTEIEELVVTSTRSPRRVEDEALRVEVLDTEEIEEKQLMTPGDIVMLLNETGGVRAQISNPSLGGAGIRIRGLPGRHTQILADGLPLFGEHAGAFGPLQIPPLDLAQVEIIKGTASALFGGSAAGGVVNLISRPPEAAFSGSAIANATTLGGADLGAFGGAMLSERVGVTALVGLHGQPRTDRDDDGWADVPGYRRAVVRPRLFWRDGTGQSTFATAGATVETRTGGTLDGRLAPDGAPYQERLETARFDAGFVGRWRAGSETWLQARASFTSLDHRHRFGALVEPDRHTTAFAEAAVSRSVGGVDLLAGGAVTLDRLTADLFPEHGYRFVVPGFFVQGERTFGPGAVAASIRLDRHRRYGTIVSPRLSVLVEPRDGWSIRASAGSGFSAPTPLVEETERNGLSRLAPLRGLRAERVLSGSLDGHGVIGPLELNVSVFASRIERPLQVREAGGGLELINASDPARAHGADLSLVFHRGPIGVTASYTYVRASEPDPDRPGRREMPLTPRHAAGMVAVHENEGGRIGLEIYYTGEQALEPNPYRESSPDYLLVGVLAERRVGGFRVFVNFENLTNVRQTESDPLLRPSRGFDGSWTVDAWAPLDGRVVNGGIRVAW